MPIKNLEELTNDVQMDKVKNNKLVKKVIGLCLFGIISVSASSYLVLNDVRSLRIKKNYQYCQQLKSDASLDSTVKKYLLERAYPPNSKFSCLEIEQQYKGLNK